MQKPNILLIILDATRADHCSCYNPARTITPALDRLAGEGVLFENAFACAPWTLPAMTAILTGRYPTETDVEAKRVLEPGYTSLPAVLKEQGYRTFAISKNAWFSAAFGLTRDFDAFHKLWQRLQTKTDLTQINLTQAYPDQKPLVSAIRAATHGNWFKNAVNLAARQVKVLWDQDYGARRTLKPVQEWISAQDGPWFALVHYLEAHLEYKPPAEWAQRFTDNWPLAQKLMAADQFRMCYRHITGVERLSPEELRVWGQLYAAEVAYQDHAMGQLLDWLRQTGRYDNTLVIVVADHGESLGEHGLLSHLYCVYDSLTRVPLVMAGPGVARGGKVGDLVQTSDVFGTALAAAGAALPSGARDLLASNRGRPYVVSELGKPRVPHPELLARYGLRSEDFAPFLRGLTAVRTADHKLIVGSDGAVELYSLADDPGENVDRARDETEMLARMEALMAAWQAEVGLTPAPSPAVAPPTIAPEVAARLKALGYLE